MKKKSFILYGASGHAKVIIDALKLIKAEVKYLFDDNSNINKLLDYNVYSNYDNKLSYNSKFIVSIGDNFTRKKIVTRLNEEFGIVVSLRAYISDKATIQEGTVFLTGAIAHPGSSIGKHCIINTNSSVDHDCFLSDFVHIGPGATICGNVEIGEGTFIGSGAVVLPNIKIGNWSIIGAGSVVTKHVPDHEIWVGNPAKKMKNNQNELS